METNLKIMTLTDIRRKNMPYNQRTAESLTVSKKHYNSIDGLRALSCMGIILMHIQANTNYILHGNFIYDRFIPSLTWLVYLFIMISGFGMCAGYLTKFQKGAVDLEYFYKKRYGKILPFFGFLLFIALIMEHSMESVYEASIELSLLHGLLPNNAVSVLGVCWTLGVIFLFYLLFPAFSVLMKTKKRAWVALLLSLWLNFVCEKHFFTAYFVTESFTPRHSFIYCLPLFIGGGLVYLYREEVRKLCEKFRWGIMAICLAATVLWYIIPSAENGIVFFVKCLIVFMLLLVYTVGVDSRFLSSKPMRFFSEISMEMYLAQMVIFRAVEKMHLLYVFGNSGVGGVISYFFAFTLTVVGLVIFIQCYKVAVKIVTKWWLIRRNRN
jgi:peptidoglycan/LPS O-acetylase OafA/YrhL